MVGPFGAGGQVLLADERPVLDKDVRAALTQRPAVGIAVVRVIHMSRTQLAEIDMV